MRVKFLAQLNNWSLWWCSNPGLTDYEYWYPQILKLCTSKMKYTIRLSHVGIDYQTCYPSWFICFMLPFSQDCFCPFSASRSTRPFRATELLQEHEHWSARINICHRVTNTNTKNLYVHGDSCCDKHGYHANTTTTRNPTSTPSIAPKGPSKRW